MRTAYVVLCTHDFSPCTHKRIHTCAYHVRSKNQWYANSFQFKAYVTGAEKECGPTRTLTQGLSLTMQALYHWATEPHDRPITISPYLIRFIPESARNHAGTKENQVPFFAARSPSTDLHWATKCQRSGKRMWPDRDSNPGSLALYHWLSYRATRQWSIIQPVNLLSLHTITPLHVWSIEHLYYKLIETLKI